MLRFVGFCGVDDSVSPRLLKDMSLNYPWIEWGVLFRTDLEGQPRYASENWVEKLCELQKESGNVLNLAGHLCAGRCQEILSGDFQFVQHLSDIGFRRVQVNATAANSVIVDTDLIEQYVVNIKRCINSVPSIEWIIQCNDETKPIWTRLIQDERPNNMSLLYDASCGKGVLVTSFVSPYLYSGIRCGYAGGIGPTTISSTLDSLFKVIKEEGSRSSLEIGSAGVWIDMESSLRAVLIEDGGTKDIFSVNKCYECVERAIEAGMTV